MNFQKIFALLLLLGAFTLPGISHAIENDEDSLAVESPEAAIMFLASFQLNNWMQTYTIPIQSCSRLRVSLNHLQLRFRNGGATIQRLAVRYGNGQIEPLTIRSNFTMGSETRWIDLGVQGMNDNRCVNALIVRGRALPMSLSPLAHTRVNVFGMTGPAM